MIFPQAGNIPRHPSQVYQFLLEGLLLFVLLWLYARKPRRQAQVSGMFLLGYGVFRFVAEFFREPDAHLLWLQQSTGLSMGQWLCVPMIVGGIVIWLWASRRPQPIPVA
jgi:phosphatidylglycerol:prolipoprotein diacylglycerol transferase